MQTSSSSQGAIMPPLSLAGPVAAQTSPLSTTSDRERDKEEDARPQFDFMITTTPENVNGDFLHGKGFAEQIEYNRKLIDLFARVEQRVDELGQDMPSEFRNLQKTSSSYNSRPASSD